MLSKNLQKKIPSPQIQGLTCNIYAIVPRNSRLGNKRRVEEGSHTIGGHGLQLKLTTFCRLQNTQSFYSRTSTDDHLHTTATSLQLPCFPIPTSDPFTQILLLKASHNGHLFTTARKFGPKVAVVERFDCISL